MKFALVDDKTRASFPISITERTGDFIGFELRGKQCRAQVALLPGGGECLVVAGYDALFVSASDARRAMASAGKDPYIVADNMYLVDAQDDGAGLERGKDRIYIKSQIRSYLRDDGDYGYTDNDYAWCPLSSIPAFKAILESPRFRPKEIALRLPSALSRVPGIVARAINRDSGWIRVYRRDTAEKVASELGRTGCHGIDTIYKIAMGEIDNEQKHSMRDLTTEMVEAMERNGLTRTNVSSRLCKGWTLWDAVSKPVGAK
jgi:hypothetical protein